MQRTARRTQLRATAHCNVPLDWNLGVQHIVALVHKQLRNAVDRTAVLPYCRMYATRHGSEQKPVPSLHVNKGFIAGRCEQKI